MGTHVIRLEPIDVLWVLEYDGPTGDAFTELEAVVGLKGRHFYGVFDVGAGSYWACVQRREGDDPPSLGLSAGTIKGGRYASARLRGDYDALVALIGPTFKAIAAQHSFDSSRPSIEFYRRHNEFVLYLPVVEPEHG